MSNASSTEGGLKSVSAKTLTGLSSLFEKRPTRQTNNTNYLKVPIVANRERVKTLTQQKSISRERFVADYKADLALNKHKAMIR